MAYTRKDGFYKKARQEGYRSRAAYKLLELNRAWRFLRPGNRVIDLGAWPGGWVQVAARAVGPSGQVLGIDLVKLEPLPLANVTLVQGDAADPERQRALLAALGCPADVVLSDMAPKLSGVREADDARVSAVCQTALTCCSSLLKPDGSVFLKTFMSAEYRAFVRALRTAFRTVKTSRPAATRKGSAEVYVLASGRRTKVCPCDGARI